LKIEIALLGRKLIILGLVLFLIGLIQGALIPYFHNPRMALSAHLAAVQSGMAMAIFGLIWALVDLKESILKIAYYTNVIGLYAVWFAISLGAAMGASRALPIAGQGFSTSPTAETVVEIIVTAGAVATVISVSLIVMGLLKGRYEGA
jgi:hydroxylaminobenzene mutase